MRNLLCGWIPPGHALPVGGEREGQVLKWSAMSGSNQIHKNVHVSIMWWHSITTVSLAGQTGHRSAPKHWSWPPALLPCEKGPWLLTAARWGLSEWLPGATWQLVQTWAILSASCMQPPALGGQWRLLATFPDTQDVWSWTSVLQPGS